MSNDHHAAKAAEEMIGQAARLFQTAMEAGVRMQQESTRSFTQMMTQWGSPEVWRQQAESTVEQTMAAFRQNLDDTVALINENTRTSMELVEKAFATLQPPGSSDEPASARELWETGLGSMRRNMEVLIQANSRVLESWKSLIDLTHKQQPAKSE